MKSIEEYKHVILQLINAVNPYPIDQHRSQRELYNEGLLIGYMTRLFQDKPEEWIYFKRHCEKLYKRKSQTNTSK